MSENLELIFLSNVLNEQSIGDFDTKARSEIFFNPVARQAWNVMLTHYREYHVTIDMRELRELVPGFAPLPTQSPAASLFEHLQATWVENATAATCERTLAGAGTPFDRLLELLAELSAVQSRVVDRRAVNIAGSIRSELDQYDREASGEEPPGLPWMWEPLQRATNGAKPGSYNLFYGRLKNGKTWVVICIIWHWLYHKYSILQEPIKFLVVSNEMPPPELKSRLICQAAGIDNKAWESRSLNEHQYQLVSDAVDLIEEMNCVHYEFVPQGIYGADAAAYIAGLCTKHNIGKGDVVLCDGAYMFAEERNHASFSAFSGGFKQLLIEPGSEKVGIVTSQGNRNAATKSSVDKSDAGVEMGFGDAPAQDCDMGAKLMLDKKKSQLHIHVDTLRVGQGCRFVTKFNPCTNWDVMYEDDLNDEDAPTATLRRGPPGVMFPAAPIPGAPTQ